jgi:pyrophosphatase PpaX
VNDIPEKEMIKNIIFDMDGTLIDTNDLIIHTLNETAKKFIGRMLTKKELNSILGHFLEEQMKLISKNNDYKVMAKYYGEVYTKNQDKMTKEFPGIKDTLKKLKELNCGLAIVSAKAMEGVMHGIEFLGIEKYIDVVVSASDVKKHKPDPEPLFMGMKKLGATKDDTLFIGDSPIDLQCGKNAGVKTVLVDWTIFPDEILNKHEPDYIINKPDELIKLFMAGK